MAAVAFL